jgi:anti-sigma B factor antagonist
MQIEFRIQGPTGVARPQGSFNAAKVDQIRGEFAAWLEANPEMRNVVVDLADVDMVDSAGLGALIALLKRVDARGGDLKLAGLSSRVRMVFEITRTHRIFDILDTVDEALAASK